MTSSFLILDTVIPRTRPYRKWSVITLYYRRDEPTSLGCVTGTFFLIHSPFKIVVNLRPYPVLIENFKDF